MKAEKREKSRILITADSSCDIADQWFRQYDIRIIHHLLQTNEGVFEDREEIDSDEFSAYLADGTKRAKSLTPDAGIFEAFFAKQLKDADMILHITISHQASPSYAAAKQAEGSFSNVCVYDSGDMSGGAGVFVLLAAHLVTKGLSLEEITETLTRFKQETCSTYVLHGTEYLREGGRMSSFLSAMLTGFLLHPVIVMKNDRINYRFAWSSRFRQNFIRRTLKNKKRIDTSLLVISYAGLTEDELMWIQEEVRRYVRFDRVYVLQSACAVTVNVGPGTFGLVFREPEAGNATQRLFDFLPKQEGQTA